MDEQNMLQWLMLALLLFIAVTLGMSVMGLGF